MKHRFTLVALALAVLLCIVSIQPALAGEKAKKAEGEMHTMVGTINKDARFEAADGNEYLLVGDKVEEVIIKQGEKVKVTGAVRSEGEGKAIAVQDYKVLDDYEFQQEMQKQKSKSMDQ